MTTDPPAMSQTPVFASEPDRITELLHMAAFDLEQTLTGPPVVTELFDVAVDQCVHPRHHGLDLVQSVIAPIVVGGSVFRPGGDLIGSFCEAGALVHEVCGRRWCA
ncbi:hypothetical protein KO481_18325 [Nocardia sp. NEAU-G5]|uniref:Uncharacterized protein n=1 Tax=Nocardia albiluteola TaxID=2842303 RepID=A0ABS6B122_9NOCA|nr:hypothetical protein [Nocardia albiluteola]MBU3063480.1 hypothetical protein [Nocardia albiluteola]